MNQYLKKFQIAKKKFSYEVSFMKILGVLQLKLDQLVVQVEELQMDFL